MTAKPVHDPTLIGALQSEVSKEASPLLEFLHKNAKLIALFFICFLLGIGAYWFYTGHQAKNRLEAMNDLGKILVVQSAEQRFAALEAYAKTAPESMQGEVLFALASTALQAGKFEAAYNAWDTLGKKNPEIEVQAAFGKVKSLMGQEKKAEALAVLEALLPSLQGREMDLINVNNQIVFLAELIGNYNRAVAACEVLASTTATQEGMTYWQQKLTELKNKAAAQKAEGE